MYVSLAIVCCLLMALGTGGSVAVIDTYRRLPPSMYTKFCRIDDNSEYLTCISTIMIR
jgi:hypothetical protein